MEVGFLYSFIILKKLRPSFVLTLAVEFIYSIFSQQLQSMGVNDCVNVNQQHLCGFLTLALSISSTGCFKQQCLSANSKNNYQFISLKLSQAFFKETAIAMVQSSRRRASSKVGFKRIWIRIHYSTGWQNSHYSRILEIKLEFEVWFNRNSKLVKKNPKKQAPAIIDHSLVGFVRN